MRTSAKRTKHKSTEESVIAVARRRDDYEPIEAHRNMRTYSKRCSEPPPSEPPPSLPKITIPSVTAEMARKKKHATSIPHKGKGVRKIVQERWEYHSSQSQNLSTGPGKRGTRREPTPHKFNTRASQPPPASVPLARVRDDTLILCELEAELRREKIAHERTQHLLQQKTDELRSARIFLDLQDNYSFTDVVALAEGLNNAILQLAAGISDSVDLSSHRVPRTDLEARQFSDVRGASKHRIGLQLQTALDTIWPGNDSSLCATWVQYALQAYLVTFCANYLSKTRWGQDEDLAEAIEEMYENICSNNSNGPHAIAGRWRSLTHKACLKLDPSLHRPRPLADHLLGIIVEILLGLGAWDATQDFKVFMNRFRGPARRLISLLIKLDIVTQQDIITGDIKPLVGTFDGDFDPRMMDDEEDMGNSAGAPRKRKQKAAVVAPVSLGLCMHTRREGKDHAEVILKPKVMLKSMTNEVLSVVD